MLLENHTKITKKKLRSEFEKRVLQLPRLESLDWRVDFVVASDKLNDVSVPSVHLNLNVKELSGTKAYAFELTEDKFRVLLAELKAAKGLLDSIK